jgi:hypothetical protein
VESSVYGGLIGVDRSAFKIGIRSFTYRNRIIFFTISDTELIVVRCCTGTRTSRPTCSLNKKTDLLHGKNKNSIRVPELRHGT